mmetsp:Transcript_41303/g.162827  ORF Transcript_41303/g.162827 Transcript_41303/m.162827 type:complete len:104 (-) Transcript_41303:1336-1647(-)
MGLALRFVDYAGSARRALFLQKTTSQLVYTILKTTAVILRGRGTGRFRAHLEKQSISGECTVLIPTRSGVLTVCSARLCRWCCGETSKDHPGCTAAAHLTYDD